MRYFDPSRDSRDQILQNYTGIGEVMGMQELDELFLQFGRQFRSKRSGLFTLDDARNSNLIFVGSPTENLTLREIPSTVNFFFRRLRVGFTIGPNGALIFNLDRARVAHISRLRSRVRWKQIMPSSP
jgi:hypothetical protein